MIRLLDLNTILRVQIHVSIENRSAFTNFLRSMFFYQEGFRLWNIIYRTNLFALFCKRIKIVWYFRYFFVIQHISKKLMIIFTFSCFLFSTFFLVALRKSYTFKTPLKTRCSISYCTIICQKYVACVCMYVYVWRILLDCHVQLYCHIYIYIYSYNIILYFLHNAIFIL